MSTNNFTEASSDKKRFGANISELMNIIIHSFYSNKEVFLRELISNSSDAIDKQRLMDLKDGIVDKSYYIRINPIEYENCLVIEDNGIGMNESDLVNHLSTIATSGTKEFVKQLTEKSDQIGQFGVGFYSAFLVADSVELITKRKNDAVYRWVSDASEYYTIEKLDTEEFTDSGTRIILHLKEDCKEFQNESDLRRIITQHSSYIIHPIQLLVEKEVEEDLVVEEEEGKDGVVVEEEPEETTEEGVVVEEEEEITDGVVEEEETKEDKKVEKVKIKVKEFEKMNGNLPIWYKKPNETTEEEYKTLYKNLSKDWEEPLFWRHFQTEGNYEFRGVLFVPKRAPFEMLDRNKEKRNIKLYVKKVLVLNELDKEMLPDWMNFVVGVFDSADLPLNVSREMLQQNKIVKAMKTQLKKQVMNMINDLYSNDDKYKEFYENFHRYLKLGIHEGDETLFSFLRIKNSKDDQLISLDTYVEELRKDENQKCIYYATGPEASTNVFSKLYVSKGYHVLYFEEPIDEFVLQRQNKYKEYDLVNINKDHATPWQTELTEEEKEKTKAFCEWIKTSLGDANIEEVRISSKLCEPTDDPICILSSKWGWTGNMEKIMQAQPLGDNKNMSFMKGRRIIEINSSHPLIKGLETKYTGDEVAAKKEVQLLYKCSLLSAGYPLENQSEFVKDIFQALVHV